jgi:hypothetical protein
MGKLKQIFHDIFTEEEEKEGEGERKNHGEVQRLRMTQRQKIG